MAKISDVAIRQAYDAAKLYFNEKINLNDAIALLPINRNSARDFILNYCQMRKGAVYHRTLSARATRYYLEGIWREEGNNALRAALSALDQHIHYFNSLGYGKQRKNREIHSEYLARLDNESTLEATYNGASQPFTANPSKTRVEIELANTRLGVPLTERESYFLRTLYQRYGTQHFQRENADAGSLRNGLAKGYLQYISGDPASLDCIFQFTQAYIKLCTNESDEETVPEDLREIETSQRDTTEKERLIKARLGQGDFRMAVIALEKKCRVTGLNNIDLLIASHIKPWRACNDEERLSPYNGLLLSPHIDKLFDRGYLSFTDNGEVLLSRISEEALRVWGLTLKNAGQFHEKQKPFLAWHRDNFFKAQQRS